MCVSVCVSVCVCICMCVLCILGEWVGGVRPVIFMYIYVQVCMYLYLYLPLSLLQIEKKTFAAYNQALIEGKLPYPEEMTGYSRAI